MGLNALLSTEEAARHLNCHAQTIRYRIRTGKLEPTERIQVGSFSFCLFSQEDLDEHVRKHPIQSRA